MSVLKSIPYGADITFKKEVRHIVSAIEARRQAIAEAIKSNLNEITELCGKLDLSGEDYCAAITKNDTEYLNLVYKELGIDNLRTPQVLATRAVGSSAGALEAATPVEYLSARDRQALKGQQKQMNAVSLRDLTNEVFNGYSYDEKLLFFERNLTQEAQDRVLDLSPSETSFFGF